MRILVVSDREYKKTSRGIDIITTVLAEKGLSVDHMVFLRRKDIPAKQITLNIRQIYFYDFPKLYRDRFRPLLPGVILSLYFSYIIKKQKKIDFSVYDWVILESGYPTYLALVINNNIIYRQSDSTEIAFNTNRNFYRKLEMITIKKASFVSSALQSIYYPKEYAHKFRYLHSGYIPILTEKKLTQNKSFVYIGSGELDWKLIRKIAEKYPEYVFNIVGGFRREISCSNVIFHGYLDYAQYQERFLNSDIAIIPYSKRFSYQLRKCSFTAKILLPMSLGMPILVKNYGLIQNTDIEKKMFVYKNHKEALALLENIIQKTESGELIPDVSNDTKDFLSPQTAENCLKELDKTFSEWIK